MITLFLVRHAKSSWKDQELTDRERPLNDRGKRDAPFMAKLLSERGVRPDIIITSPAVRAATTAKFFSREMKYKVADIVSDEALYQASMDGILQRVREIEDRVKTAMVVGHNPEITLLSDFVTGGSIDDVPTCGIACIEFAFDHWRDVGRGNGILKYFEYPKKYFK